MHYQTPFTLHLPKQSESSLSTSSSTRYEINGIARLDGRSLVLEWSGKARISETGLTTARTREEAGPSGLCELPLAELASAVLRGRWWRPRLEITTSSLGSLAEVPGARGARLVLWLSRDDWSRARELCAELRLAMAELALEGAQRPADLPGPEWAIRLGQPDRPPELPPPCPAHIGCRDARYHR